MKQLRVPGRPPAGGRARRGTTGGFGVALGRRRARGARPGVHGTRTVRARCPGAARWCAARRRDVHRCHRGLPVRGLRARLPDRCSRGPGPGPGTHPLTGCPPTDRSRSAGQRRAQRLPAADRRVQRPVRRGPLQPRAPANQGLVTSFDQWQYGGRPTLRPTASRSSSSTGRVADLARGLRRQPRLRAETPQRRPERDRSCRASTAATWVSAWMCSATTSATGSTAATAAPPVSPAGTRSGSRRRARTW